MTRARARVTKKTEPSGRASPVYGEAIAWARDKLARTGYVVPWEIAGAGYSPGHVCSRLAQLGEAVPLFGSTLYVRATMLDAIAAYIEKGTP